MKKLMICAALFVFISGSAFAQAQSLLYPESKNLKVDEVPITILNSFEKDFANSIRPDDGKWSVTYIEQPEKGKTYQRFRPVSFSFKSKKKGSDNIIITYSPEGELKSVEGITAHTGGG
ncbi:MAG TPA: hypothetical protein PKJ63_03835 [Cyclobacteriaceae bacterium]|nr:hypothetical protein [Cyclobacteriaceae bacterium]